MLPHPTASPASSSTSIRNEESRTRQSVTSTPPSSSFDSTWVQRENSREADENDRFLESPTPSPRVLRSQSNRHNRELSLTLNLNLLNENNNNNDDDDGLNEVNTSTSNNGESGRVILEGIDLLSSGLEQLEVDTLSNNRVRGTRGNQDTNLSSSWLRSRRATLDNLVDPELLEEHWYSMTNTPFREAEEQQQDENYELISNNSRTLGEMSPLDGDEGVIVDDEACFVDCYDGAVDFLSSLPYELSLYILLHLEREALLSASQVSKQWHYLSMDNLIWRDLFHREAKWRIREDIIQQANLTANNYDEEYDRVPGTPLRRNGSVASGLGRGGGGSLSSSLVMEETISTATPRRPASGILSNPFSPLLNSLTVISISTDSPLIVRQQQQMPPTPTPTRLSRHSSISTSTNPLSPSSSTTLLPPPLRRASSATIPPLGLIPSPSFGDLNPNAPLFLDWPTLYKDRFILDKRWEKGLPKASWLQGHEDSVYCIQYDAGKVISGSRDQTIRIWDIQTGKCIKVLKGHSGSVLCLQYDDKVLVSGSSDSRVLIWDLVGEEGTGIGKYEIKASLLGHQMGVLDLCFDDKWIVTCSKDTTIRVWDKETGQHYRTLSGHRGPINALQLLNDKVVSASGDGTMKLWSVLTGEVIRVFTGHLRGLACVQYASSGKLLASGSNDKTIKIWDPETGACLNTFKGHKELVRTLCFDETRRRLVSGSYDHSIKVWDLDTGNLLLSHAGHASLVFDVSFSASKIVSCSHDHKILVLDFGYGLNVSKFI